VNHYLVLSSIVILLVLKINQFRRNYVYAYDLIIILLQEDLCEPEVELAKRIQQYELPMCFIRSKCDFDIINEVYSSGSTKEITQEMIDRHLRDCKIT
jgi:hypothetical protein